MNKPEPINTRGNNRKALVENSLLSPLGIGGKRSLYHCNYCQKDISTVPRIKCAVCPDYDLCLECFSIGLELTPHKRSHDYRVIDNLSFPVYQQGWAADEEMLLLEGVEIYGLGNWVAVAEHVGSQGKAECQAHYGQIYIDSPAYPLAVPLPNIAATVAKQLGHPAGGTLVAAAAERGAPNLLLPAPAPLSAVGPWAGPSASTPQVAGGGADASTPMLCSTAGGTPADARAGQASEVHPGGPSTSGGAGDHPVDSVKACKRHEHQEMDSALAAAAPALDTHVGVRSVHHDAPPGPAGTGGPPTTPWPSLPQTNGDGTPAGALVVDPGAPVLLAGKAAAGVKSTLNGGAAALPNGEALVKLENLGRGTGDPTTAAKALAAAALAAGIPEATGYHVKRHEFDPEYDQDAEVPFADLEFLDSDSASDRQIKLAQLATYNARLDERERRRDFILEQGLLNAQRQQAQEKRRGAVDREGHSQLRVFCRYKSAQDELVDGLLLEHRLRSRIQEVQEYRRQGIRTLAEAEASDAAQRRLRDGGGAGRAGGKAAPAVKEEECATLLAPPSCVAAADVTTGLAGILPAVRNAVGPLAAVRARRGVPLDITCLAGVQLLGAQERDFCAAARMLPPHYLACKEITLQLAGRLGALARHEARASLPPNLHMDPARAMRLYDFLVASGWLDDCGRLVAARGWDAGHSPVAAVAGGTAGGTTQDGWQGMGTGGAAAAVYGRGPVIHPGGYPGAPGGYKLEAVFTKLEPPAGGDGGRVERSATPGGSAVTDT